MCFDEESNSLELASNIDDPLESNYPNIQSSAFDIFGDSASADVLAPLRTISRNTGSSLMNVTSIDKAAVALCGDDKLLAFKTPELMESDGEMLQRTPSQ